MMKCVTVKLPIRRNHQRRFSEEDILSLIAEFLGYELQIGEVGELDPEVIKLISSEIARQYAIIPLYRSETGIHFLAADPFNSSIIDDLTFALNVEIHLVVCDPDQVMALLDHYYPSHDVSVHDILGESGFEDFRGY